MSLSHKQTLIHSLQISLSHTHTGQGHSLHNMTCGFSNHKAHMCSHPADPQSADSLLKMCVKQVTQTWWWKWTRKGGGKGRGEGGGEFRCVLTMSTDVLTTSETLCLSSAAVPGLPRPRVNFLVSGCTGVAIVAHHFASMTVLSTSYINKV